MDKVFAPQTPRNEQGWYLFPRDIGWRKELFPKEVFRHPAKMNMFLEQELIRYLTEPGDIILDPFGGTGTLLIGTLEGRHVTLIELEPAYVELLHESINGLPEHDANIIVLPGDCRQVLPVPCDHVITSPPYSSALATPNGLKSEVKRYRQEAEDVEKYAGKSSSPLNVGRLNPFYYKYAMDKVYQLLFQSIKPGGSLSVVIKDVMKQGERVFLSEGCIKSLCMTGFVLQEWFKWKPPGSATLNVMKARGAQVVDDEDIFVFRKP